MRLQVRTARDQSRWQLLWIALTRSTLQLTVARINALNALLQKIEQLSIPTEGGGRSPKEPCDLDLTKDEQVMAVQAIAATRWSKSIPDIAEHVKDLCKWLGAEIRDEQGIRREQGA